LETALAIVDVCRAFGVVAANVHIARQNGQWRSRRVCAGDIHDHVREDVRDLYGFLSSADLSLFDQLLSISGVGPKVAMTILGIGSADTVRRAIMSGDLAMLTSVPGVGKKTAQKIILELKGQLVELAESSPMDQEVIQALQGLGYTVAQAREAVKLLSPDLTNTSDRVREALRSLAK
jgi:Holliday junction DNA helicase RuvA